MSFFQRIKDRVKKSPTFVKMSDVRDKLAERILVALLAFFDFVGPVWNFLFLRTGEKKIPRWKVIQ